MLLQASPLDDHSYLTVGVDAVEASNDDLSWKLDWSIAAGRVAGHSIGMSESSGNNMSITLLV